MLGKIARLQLMGVPMVATFKIKREGGKTKKYYR